MKPTDIRIIALETRFSNERARTPLKFGAVIMDEVTYCTVAVRVENRAGAVADGWGAIFLADFWANPNPEVSHETGDAVMRSIVESYSALVMECYASEYQHPIDIWMQTQDGLRRISREAATEHGLPEKAPWLVPIVSVSPVDGALHDAFGRAAAIPCYVGYGKEHLSRDLAAYLEPVAGATTAARFRDTYPADFLRREPVSRVPIFHLVGGLDKLTAAEVSDDDPQDGLPRSLEEWIERDGIYCLKVKLTGHDVEWDVERTATVAQVARQAHARRVPGSTVRLFLTADANEQSASAEAAVEYLRRLRERDAAAFDALLYLEQPTSRDLEADPIDVRPIARLKPVIGDECVADLTSAERALALGWSGFALKTCKGQSFCLLALSRAAGAGIPYAVQDLANPGLALLHSVGLVAWSNPIKGVEYNSRQYYPRVSPDVRQAHPDVFTVRDGEASTASLGNPGLGYRADCVVPLKDSPVGVPGTASAVSRQ